MVQFLTEVDVFGVLLPLWVLNPIQSSSHVFSLTNSTGKKNLIIIKKKSSFSYNLSPDTSTNQLV